MGTNYGRTALLAVALLLAACTAAEGEPTVLELRELNDSGVTGTVTLTGLGSDRTRVEIDVEPAGNPSMPAHIHPGTCDELVPQPKYALENVLDGTSVTEVAVPADELLADRVALNIHRSNAELDVYTACIEL